VTSTVNTATPTASVADRLDVVVIADPLEHLDPAIDTTLALIGAAQRRGHRVQWCQAHQLALHDGRPAAHVAAVGTGCESRWMDLGDADVVLFRTDPPVDRRYLDATFILDQVDATETVLVNDPRGIRLANEKLWALTHPELCPPTLVAADAGLIDAFVAEHRRCVIKPIDGHAGRGVLRLDHDDPNRASITELLTEHGRRPAIVQPWLEAVAAGNKRIYLHAGEPVAAALRYPAGGDFRIGMPDRLAPLTDREQHICDTLGPELVELGLILVGLDVIDDLLIEVNVTSSGALHKADQILGTTLCADLIRQLEHLHTTRRPR
jgi:glutathione synthase